MKHEMPLTRGENQADALRLLTAPTDAGNPFVRAESGQPQRISLVEHERTMDRLAREIAELRRDRVHIADVLSAFREAPLSISSVQPVLDLTDALCGPKETPCPPSL